MDTGIAYESALFHQIFYFSAAFTFSARRRSFTAVASQHLQLSSRLPERQYPVPACFESIMANIQVDDILAGTPAVQCKTKVRAPSARDVRDPTSRFPTRLSR